MSDAIDDDDGWVEQRKGAAAVRADVTVSVNEPGQRRMDGPNWRACARIMFRGEAAAWIEAQNRFRVEIGGKLKNKIRITADDRGKFESHQVWGVTRLPIGRVPAWPDMEGRETTEAAWTVAGTFMVLTLPDDWATPRSADVSP